MPQQFFWLVAPCLSLCLVFMTEKGGDAAGCPQCGCAVPCEKVCRLVKDERKITTTCWGCKCEDFCVGGPSCPGCDHCEMVCTGKGPSPVSCIKPKRLVWTDWIPGCCADIYTRKKLMKRTVTKKVPSFKWVVEDLCEKCQSECEVVQAESEAEIPPIPNEEVKVLRNVTFQRAAK